MEKITLYYSPIGASGNVAHHKYIVYENSAGQKFMLQGYGSEKPGWSPADEFISDVLSGAGSFGYLTGLGKLIEDDDFRDSHWTNESEVIDTGADLTAKVAAMYLEIEFIKSEYGTYIAWEHNSNTFADRLLLAAGYPLAELDDFSENWSPGSLGGSLDGLLETIALAATAATGLTEVAQVRQVMEPMRVMVDSAAPEGAAAWAVAQEREEMPGRLVLAAMAATQRPSL